jgi:predicted dehydrogenase
MANLRALGVRKLAVADPIADRLRPAVDELGVEAFSDFKDALGSQKPDVVFVCTPPVFHVEQALQAVRSGAHVFVEKPLCDRLDLVDELSAEAVKRGRAVHVGYNMRFHPGVQTLKRLLGGGAIGRVLWAHVEVGQYLPDWRPWQDYRQSYTAQREKGGGIILDASHEIDYVIWLLGPPSELTCMAGKVSRLEVDVEDCATILLRFPGGAQADVHMDFVQPTYSRSCVLVGERGKLLWDYSQNQVRIVRPEGDVEILDYDFELNQMYLSEVKLFLENIGNKVVANSGLADAKLTLQVALAARKSAAEKKWVRFDQ